MQYISTHTLTEVSIQSLKKSLQSPKCNSGYTKGIFFLLKLLELKNNFRINIFLKTHKNIRQKKPRHLLMSPPVTHACVLIMDFSESPVIAFNQQATVHQSLPPLPLATK